MVTIPRAELEALKAELRHLRLEAARAEALRQTKTFLAAGPESGGRLFTIDELAEAWGIRD